MILYTRNLMVGNSKALSVGLTLLSVTEVSQYATLLKIPPLSARCKIACLKFNLTAMKAFHIAMQSFFFICVMDICSVLCCVLVLGSILDYNGNLAKSILNPWKDTFDSCNIIYQTIQIFKLKAKPSQKYVFTLSYRTHHNLLFSFQEPF